MFFLGGFGGGWVRSAPHLPLLRYHGAPGGNLTYSECGGVDFHDSTEADIHGAAMSGPASLNNTYDQVVFTDRAVSLITAHAGTPATAAQPFFLFLACAVVASA